MCRQLEIRQPKMCLIHGNFQKSSLFFFVWTQCCLSQNTQSSNTQSDAMSSNASVIVGCRLTLNVCIVTISAGVASAQDENSWVKKQAAEMIASNDNFHFNGNEITSYLERWFHHVDLSCCRENCLPHPSQQLSPQKSRPFLIIHIHATVAPSLAMEY